MVKHTASIWSLHQLVLNCINLYTGLDLSIQFSTRLGSIQLEWALNTVKDNMEDVYDSSGYGWDDDDKWDELTEQGLHASALSIHVTAIGCHHDCNVNCSIRCNHYRNLLTR